MNLAKRTILFIILNIFVMVTITMLTKTIGLEKYLYTVGINIYGLALFCLVWGIAGSLISLSMSRLIAKWTIGVQVINPNTQNQELQFLLQTVYHLSEKAGLSVMPEVGIYDSPEVNAFATGPTKSRSLVAVSTGLLSKMNNSEIKGVLGHEVAHIANGDMVTMTLLQGVVNSFVLFLSRIIAFTIIQGNRSSSEDRNRESNYMIYYILSFVLEIVFMILGSLIVAAFSRHREYRADSDGARLAGRDNMVNALEALQRTYKSIDSISDQCSFQSMKISSRYKGLLYLFSTHPSLEKRISRFLFNKS